MKSKIKLRGAVVQRARATRNNIRQHGRLACQCTSSTMRRAGENGAAMLRTTAVSIAGTCKQPTAGVLTQQNCHEEQKSSAECLRRGGEMPTPNIRFQRRCSATWRTRVKPGGLYPTFLTILRHGPGVGLMFCVMGYVLGLVWRPAGSIHRSRGFCSQLEAWRFPPTTSATG